MSKNSFQKESPNGLHYENDAQDNSKHPDIMSLNKVIFEKREFNIPNGDEIGITIRTQDQIKFRQLCTSDVASKAPDRREEGGIVGFHPMEAAWLRSFLTEIMMKSGYVGARRSVIDVNEQLCKLVVVVFVMCNNRVILVPRYNKTILSNVFTTSVMESLTLDDLWDAYDLDAYSEEVSAEHLLQTNDQYPYLYRVTLRGIIEEFPFVTLAPPLFHGIVGGGKDLGLVFGIKIEDPFIFRKIVEATSRVTFDPEKQDYTEVVKYYGGDIDGWSEAILRYVLANT